MTRQPTLTEIWHQLGAHQKSAQGSLYYSRFINRPLGRVLSTLAIRIGLTPNQATVASALVTALGLLLLFLTDHPDAFTAVLAGFLLVLGFALDSVDGQLARFYNLKCELGDWFDHLVDSFKVPAAGLVVASVALSHIDRPGTLATLFYYSVVPLSSSLFFSMMLVPRYERYRQAYLSTGTTHAADRTTGSSAIALRLGASIVDYGFLCVAVFFAFSSLFPLLIGIWVLAYMAFWLVNVGRTWRRLSALPPLSSGPAG
jgi:phosphatidylglycerophosphate synthase